MNAIETLRLLLKPQLTQFDQLYSSQMLSSVPLVNEINEYLRARSGKQIRPLLLLASAQAGLYPGSGHEHDKVMATKTKLALAMEILHNSSLMHDDVVDESALRRGQETVRQHWSNKIAVLCGDYYLAQVMAILNQVNDKEVSMIVDRTVIEMSEGELLQQQISRSYDQDEENYNNVIFKKTASLMGACCEIGYRMLREFGVQFGMAFQIRDDILDYHPESETGKPCGNDIKENKMTLPLLCYLQQNGKEEQIRVRQLFESGPVSDADARNLSERVRQSGALHLAHMKLSQRIQQAIEALKVLPDSPYRAALEQLSLSLSLEK